MHNLWPLRGELSDKTQVNPLEPKTSRKQGEGMKEEKVEFKNSRGLKLVGTLHKPDKETQKIVVLSHGFTSNKDRISIIKLSKRICEVGFAALRFDFGGSGESDFAPINIENLMDDLKFAIKTMKERGYTRIGLLGVSLGGLCSILVYNEEIKFLVLLAPVTESKTPTSLGERRAEMEERGFVSINRDGREFRVEKEYLEFRESLNQKELLSGVNCPVLIIHGNKDEFVPLEHSKEALNYLPKESKLEVIEGANHKFTGYEEKVAEISSKWIKEMFK